MDEWGYAQSDPAQQLARLHFFSVKKLQDRTEIDMTITVKEFVSPPFGALTFFAQADKEVNQKIGPYVPFGWGSTLLEALRNCMTEVDRFPYEGDLQKPASA